MPAALRNAKADDFDRTPAGHHALGLRCCEPGGDQLDQHVNREAMGKHDGLSAAVSVVIEQFERSARVAGGVRLRLGVGIGREHRMNATTSASLADAVNVAVSASKLDTLIRKLHRWGVGCCDGLLWSRYLGERALHLPAPD